MAGTSARNVAVGKPNLEVSGGILAAVLGSSRPTDAETPLEEAYETQGYVGEDGVTETSERSTETIRAWGGVKVRTVQTEYGCSISLTLIESRRAATLRTVFGEENVVVSGGVITVKRNEKVLPHRQYVIDMKDGDNARRLDIGYGQVTEVGDISYVDGEAISYEITISCDPDDNGDSLVEYLTDPEGAGTGE